MDLDYRELVRQEPDLKIFPLAENAFSRAHDFVFGESNAAETEKYRELLTAEELADCSYVDMEEMTDMLLKFLVADRVNDQDGAPFVFEAAFKQRHDVYYGYNDSYVDQGYAHRELFNTEDGVLEIVWFSTKQEPENYRAIGIYLWDNQFDQEDVIKERFYEQQRRFSR